MNYTKLGNSDLNVSRICMGCMGFGEASRGQHSWTLDEEHSREIIIIDYYDEPCMTTGYFMRGDWLDQLGPKS